MTLSNRLGRALKVRKGEWKPLAVFFLIIAFTSVALESADVVATSSYLSQLGIEGIPLLWIADMWVILLSSALYSLVADRFRRTSLLKGLLVLFGLLLLANLLLLSSGLPETVGYTALYVIVDQQLIIFPLAFWALANDAFSIAAGRRLFPLIMAGGLIGNVFGNWIAGQSALYLARRGLSNDALLIGCSLIFFAAAGMLAVAFRSDGTRGRPRGSEKRVLREALRVGADVVRKVPLFRFLALVFLFNEISLTIIEYSFLAQTTQSFGETARFQAFYGTYKAGLTALLLVMELLIAGRLLQRSVSGTAFSSCPQRWSVPRSSRVYGPRWARP